MRLGPLINIQITPAQLGLNIFHGSMRLEQGHASMTLEQSQAVMRVQNPSGHLQIDNSAVLQELGLGSPLVLAREQAAASIRTAQQGTARRAQDGDRMMRQPQVIGTIAKETVYSSNQVETNVGLLPRSRPEITYVGDPKPHIDFTPQTLSIQVNIAPTRVDTTRAAVDAYLKQRGSVKIEYIGPREIWA